MYTALVCGVNYILQGYGSSGNRPRQYRSSGSLYEAACEAVFVANNQVSTVELAGCREHVATGGVRMHGQSCIVHACARTRAHDLKRLVL